MPTTFEHHTKHAGNGKVTIELILSSKMVKLVYAQAKLIPEIKTNYASLEEADQREKTHLIGFESIGKKIQISIYLITLSNMYLVESKLQQSQTKRTLVQQQTKSSSF